MHLTSSIKGLRGSKNVITVISLQHSAFSVSLCFHFSRRYFPQGFQEGMYNLRSHTPGKRTIGFSLISESYTRYKMKA